MKNLERSEDFYHFMAIKMINIISLKQLSAQHRNLVYGPLEINLGKNGEIIFGENLEKNNNYENGYYKWFRES